MFAILCQAYGWTHAEIMKMTPRQTRAYFKQLSALRAAEQQRWLVVAAAAATQNPDVVNELSSRLNDTFQKNTGASLHREKGGLITTDPTLIRAFLNGGAF